MKIIITEEQLSEIEKIFGRDWMDAKYSDEYPKYKGAFFKAIQMDITASGETETSIMLGDSDGKVLIRYQKPSRTIYYDYNWSDDVEKLVPWHIYSRHFRYALAEYFNNIFPNVTIKDVSGAHVS
jgi:hypothetical protein